MEIIIDTNIASRVFDNKDKTYLKLRQRITSIKKPHRMVYGGTKFKTELAPVLHKYRKLFIELKKSNNVVELDENKVNKKEKEILKINSKKDLDDEHIIACILLSRCVVVCTDDKRADTFIKDKNNQFYKNRKKPKIYRFPETHDHLLE